MALVHIGTALHFLCARTPAYLSHDVKIDNEATTDCFYKQDISLLIRFSILDVSCVLDIIRRCSSSVPTAQPLSSFIHLLSISMNSALCDVIKTADSAQQATDNVCSLAVCRDTSCVYAVLSEPLIREKNISLDL